MNNSYLSNHLQKHAQRYIRAIYRRCELGHYEFSSTMTLIEYRYGFFGVIAYHALAKENSLDNMYYLKINGNFVKLSELLIRTKYFKEDDIAVGFLTTEKSENLNFFDIENYDNNLEVDSFYWFGFPSSWSKKKYRNNIDSEEIVENFISQVEDGNYHMSNNKYYGIAIKRKFSNEEDKILGTFENKNLYLEKKGHLSKGISLKGMSGGALFYVDELIEAQSSSFEDLSLNLNKYFKFIGIGLEYNQKIIETRGLSKKRLLELMKIFFNELKDNPIKW